MLTKMFGVSGENLLLIAELQERILVRQNICEGQLEYL